MGAHEASLRGCPLKLIHTLPRWQGDVPLFPPGRLEKEELRGKEIVEEAVAIVRDAYPAVEVTSGMPNATPAAALRHESENARAVVIGAKGEDLGNLLLGSATLQLIGHAESPVVVVGHVAAGHGVVTVGTDGSEDSHAALRFAFEEASLRKARLHALYALGRPHDLPAHLMDRPDEPVEAKYVEALHAQLAPLREEFPDVEVVEDVRHVGPLHILAHASQKSDLLVLGSRGKGGFHGLAVGSVTHKLLHFASCPVAVVRAS